MDWFSTRPYEAIFDAPHIKEAHASVTEAEVSGVIQILVTQGYLTPTSTTEA